MDENKSQDKTLELHQLLADNQSLKEQLKTYEEIYNRFDFDEMEYHQHREHLRAIGNTKIDIMLKFLNRMKYIVAERSLRECKDAMDMQFSNGSFRLIEELQKILIESRSEKSFINHIT